jgi:putative transposase
VVIEFIDTYKSQFGVEPICAELSKHGCGIAPSTYYAAKTRPPSARRQRDEELVVEIRRVHFEIGRGLYGVRKVWHQLLREEIDVARCTVERLMRREGLQGARRGKTFRTTRPDGTATRPPDLVQRQFRASRPNELWVVDFTYVPTWSGMAFSAFVNDVCSRRIVGWRTANAMPTELPLDALEMALWTRAQADELVEGLIHHSDAGSQYTSIVYSQRLEDVRAVASIGSVGDSYDNAMAESVIGLYKTECVRHEGPWRGVDDLELATMSWVWWFNEIRLHSEIGYVTPIEFEAHHYRQIDSQPHPRLGEPSLY